MREREEQKRSQMARPDEQRTSQRARHASRTSRDAKRAKKARRQAESGCADDTERAKPAAAAPAAVDARAKELPGYDEILAALHAMRPPLANGITFRDAYERLGAHFGIDVRKEKLKRVCKMSVIEFLSIVKGRNQATSM
jgi:hypothetical protein